MGRFLGKQICIIGLLNIIYMWIAKSFRGSIVVSGLSGIVTLHLIKESHWSLRKATFSYEIRSTARHTCVYRVRCYLLSGVGDTNWEKKITQEFTNCPKRSVQWAFTAHGKMTQLRVIQTLPFSCHLPHSPIGRIVVSVSDLSFLPLNSNLWRAFTNV